MALSRDIGALVWRRPTSSVAAAAGHSHALGTGDQPALRRLAGEVLRRVPAIGIACIARWTRDGRLEGAPARCAGDAFWGCLLSNTLLGIGTTEPSLSGLSVSECLGSLLVDTGGGELLQVTAQNYIVRAKRML